MVPAGALPLSAQVAKRVRKTQRGLSTGTTAELLILRDAGDIVRHDVITRINLLDTHSVFAHEKGNMHIACNNFTVVLISDK